MRRRAWGQPDRYDVAMNEKPEQTTGVIAGVRSIRLMIVRLDDGTEVSARVPVARVRKMMRAVTGDRVRLETGPSEKAYRVVGFDV